LPPVVALLWWLKRVSADRCGPWRAAAGGVRGMCGFVALMALADVAVTGFALLPLSPRAGQDHPSLDGRFPPALGRLVTRAVETPIPQDWVGFATQMRHQRSGGSSYLLGESRARGWWYYYFVALAVKVPLTFWTLMLARAVTYEDLGTCLPHEGRARGMGGWFIPVVVAAFLAATAVGSSRNYGLRYLLPLSPLAVVWVSALAERPGIGRGVAWAGLLGQAVAVAG